MFSATEQHEGEIALSGRLDASQTENANAVFANVNTSKTLDFRDLEYISSAGLGVLLATQQRLKAGGHALKLINLNKHIRDVFMFTGFDRIFVIE